jgi:hypothetical protein
MSKIELAPEDTIHKCNTFAEAVMYVDFLIIDDKRNWRLPTRLERAQWGIYGTSRDSVYWDLDDYYDTTDFLNVRYVRAVRDID